MALASRTVATSKPPSLKRYIVGCNSPWSEAGTLVLSKFVASAQMLSRPDGRQSSGKMNVVHAAIIREVFQSTHFNPRLAEKSSAHEGDRDGSEKTEIAWRQAQKKQQERRQEENQDERFGIRQAE